VSLVNSGFKLRPHQEEVLNNWEINNYFGFVQHGTASGKTITGLEAIKRWQDSNYYNYSLVAVPTKVLLKQWIDEINNYFEDVFILVKGGGLDTNNWRGAILTFKEKSFFRRYNIILTTYSSLAGNFPLEKIQGKNLLFVADEAHNLGTMERKKILEMSCGANLGLSATPNRFDDEETDKIISFFKNILHPVYGIGEGIEDGYLSQYNYYVGKVSLTLDEFNDWEERTKSIVRVGQMMENEKNPTVKRDLKSSLDRQRQERAKIKKSAVNKQYFVRPILEKNYQKGDRWLIYCHDINQLEAVRESIKDLDITVLRYVSATNENISNNLEYFSKVGGVILCCKMLDEGVNVPKINKGIILASSQSEREFIQRRGRLLRVADNKYKAEIWDTIVVPPHEQNTSDSNLMIPEIERAAVFSQTAKNTTSILNIESIALEYGIDFENIRQKLETK